MECIARFALNIFFGSIITFYLTLLITLLLRLVIRSPRALYFLYILPFIKVTYDLIFASHSQWVFTHGEKILNQPENSRTLNALLGHKGAYPFAELKLSLESGQLFSLGDVCFEVLGQSMTLFFGLTLIILTVLSLCRFGLQLWKSTKWKNNLLKGSRYYDQFRGVPIHSTQQKLNSPLLIGTWNPLILCPEKLLRAFTEEEKKAVFSHEKGHVVWKDNAINSILMGIFAFFWFIPFKKALLNKASFYRELDCDAKGVPLHIATALQKTHVNDTPIGSIAFSSSFHRIKKTLKTKKPGKIKTYLSFLFLLGGMLFIMASHFLPF